MIDTLFRKDVRLLRPVVWAAIACGLIFYLIGPTATLLDRWYRGTLGRPWYMTGGRAIDINPREAWENAAAMFIDGAGFMWIVNLLLIATVAGMAFAVERRERWGEFAAMLPVSRRRAVAAKAMASFAVVGGLLAVNAIVFVIAVSLAGRWDVYLREMNAGRGPGLYETIWQYVGLMTGMAGVAWLLSSLLRSATIATAAGIATVVVVWFFYLVLSDQRRGTSDADLRSAVAWGAFVLGAVGLAAGTMVQLRRQSP